MNAARHLVHAGSATAAWFGFWSRFGLLGLMAGLALLGLLLYAIGQAIAVLAGALIALIVGLIAARFRWPKVRVKHYFADWRGALSLALAAFGLTSQFAITDAFAAPSATLAALAWAVPGAASLCIVIAIFEGKFMKSIFDLVPIDQQAEFSEFLAGSAGGKHPDFTRLDPAGVIERIKDRVVGQDDVIEPIVRALFTRARLPRPNKPVAVYMLVGPSGTGKSELAKALAAELFGDKKFIRCDLSEYMTPESATRLIGMPLGYQGADQGGWLPREMQRAGGTGLLLLDEVEKADPAVMRLLLALLDEARITEASTNKTYSATGFVIVLTSNLHQEEIIRIVDAVEDPQERAAMVKAELKAGGFTQEQIGRIDEIFPFKPLDRVAVAEIVSRYLIQRAETVGVHLVRVDASLLVDLIQRHEKDNSGGVRSLTTLAENAVTDGLLAVKDGGYRDAAIRVIDGKVSVQPVAADSAA